MLPEITFGIGTSFQTYFVFLSLLYTSLLFYVLKRSSKLKINVTASLNVALIIMVLGFVGGRLFHVIYEAPKYYFDHPFAIIDFFRGGFIYYGGLILALAGVAIYLHRVRLNFWTYADAYAPILALGTGIGRLSCFMAGCCYGQACAFPWSIGGRHPTQLYALFWELSLWLSMWLIEKYSPRLRVGSLFLIWLFGHAIGRMIQEQFRDDERGPEVLGLSISSLLSIIIFLSSSYAFYRVNGYKSQKS